MSGRARTSRARTVLGGVFLVLGVGSLIAGLVGFVSGPGELAAEPRPSTSSTGESTTAPSESRPPSASASPIVESPEEFVAAFTTAIQTNDVSFLLGRLHPRVLELYGQEACAAYVPSVINPDFELTIRESSGPETWEWVIDDVTSEIADSYAVEVSRMEGGQTLIQEIHVARRAEGDIGWFTDCGDPL